MPSRLKSNSLYINNTQEVTGIYTALNNSDSQIPTSGAIVTFLRNKGIQPLPPVSLSVSGSWGQSFQHVGEVPDPSGLTFTATFSDGAILPVTVVSVRPLKWTATGTQTATFYYTVAGTTVTTTKDCIIIEGEILLNKFQADSDITSLSFT